MLLLKWVLPSADLAYGAPALDAVLDKGQGVAVEAVLTFFLVWVIFAAPPTRAARSTRSPGSRSAS